MRIDGPLQFQGNVGWLAADPDGRSSGRPPTSLDQDFDWVCATTGLIRAEGVGQGHVALCCARGTGAGHRDRLQVRIAGWIDANGGDVTQNSVVRT